MVDFAIHVTNNGDGTARDVVVVDKLPAFLALDYVTTTWGSATVEGNTARVDIGELLPDDKVVIHIHARVLAHAFPPYNSDTVVLSSATTDKNKQNNTVTFLVWTFAGW
jgi:uncharacterized repeat protein (TIGR01451 family)